MAESEDPWPLELELKINDGGLSEVFKGTFKGQAVAVKCTRQEDCGDRCRRQMLAEVKALRMLEPHPHANVGSMIAFSEPRMQLVLPYYACDLLEYIMTVGCVPEPNAKILFRQMVDAVKHCHSLQIAHGDIKPENFMLKTFPLEGVRPYNPAVVLIDFGGASDASRSSKDMCISVRYAAPELRSARESKRVLSVSSQMKADLWSMGVSLFCILHSFLPYSEKCPLDKLEEGKFGSERRWLMSSQASSMVRGLMVGDPDSRRSMDACARHAWFLEKPQTWLEWGLSALY
jgi:serine kinase